MIRTDSDKIRLCVSLVACGLVAMIAYVPWTYVVRPVKYGFYYRLATDGVLCVIPGIEQRSARIMLKGFIGGLCVRAVAEMVGGFLVWNTAFGDNPLIMKYMPPKLFSANPGGLLPNHWALVANCCIWMFAIAFVWADTWKIKRRAQFACLCIAPSFVLSRLLANIAFWDTQRDFYPYTTLPRPPDLLLVSVVLFSIVPLSLVWLRMLVHVAIERQKAKRVTVGESVAG